MHIGVVGNSNKFRTMLNMNAIGNQSYLNKSNFWRNFNDQSYILLFYIPIDNLAHKCAGNVRIFLNAVH
jgi:hypothetical protein